MSDREKSREELLEELAKLREQVRAQEESRAPEDPERPLEAATVDPDERPGLDRRRLLASAWIAPVVLSIELPGAQAARARQSVPAEDPRAGVAPTSTPTVLPTRIFADDFETGDASRWNKTKTGGTAAPTLSPTKSPTRKPTAFPTTLKPTKSPTQVPTAHPTTPIPTTASPTQRPTKSPTQVPTAHPTTPIPTTASPTQVPTAA